MLVILHCGPMSDVVGLSHPLLSTSLLFLALEFSSLVEKYVYNL